MEMIGEARLAAPRKLVWDALNDPDVLRASIPGCETLERTTATGFAAQVVAQVGPIKARFSGNVSVSNIVVERSYTLIGEGQGGPAGFVKSEIDVSLEPLAPTLTLLRYTVKAQIGGKLAQLGARMIESVARRNAEEFFARFTQEIGRLVSGEVPTAAGQAPVSPSVRDARPAPAAVRAPIPRPQTKHSTSPPVAAAPLPGDEITVWIADEIAVVTLNRPAQRNAMTFAMWQAVPGILAALEADPAVRAILLTGAGTDFCAGADIPEFERVRADVGQATAYEVAVDACCDAIMDVAKPTIAVLRGYCLGGGAHLAMSCDFRFAAHDAVFGIPAAKLSIVYGVKATRKLLALVGLTAAKRILYGAERFDAREALRLGFVDQIAGRRDPVPTASWWQRLAGGGKREIPAGDPMVDARAFARKVIGNAPLSIAGAKYILNGCATDTGALDLAHAETLIAQAAGSEDYREGRAAFAAKRPPGFKGR